jgi:hypothetical protein
MGLNERGIVIRFPAEAKDIYFSFLQIAQTGSQAQIATYSMGTGGFFHGVNRPGLKLTTASNLCQGQQ